MPQEVGPAASCDYQHPSAVTDATLEQQQASSVVAIRPTCAVQKRKKGFKMLVFAKRSRSNDFVTFTIYFCEDNSLAIGVGTDTIIRWFCFHK